MVQVAGLVATIRYPQENTVNISCWNTSKIQIQKISVQEEETTCRLKACDLNSYDTQTIEDNCNGEKSCLVDYNFTSTCLREFRYINLSYTCKHENKTSLSTFEVDFEIGLSFSSNRTTWTRDALLTDHTRVNINALGYSLYAFSYDSAGGTVRIDTDKELMQPICLSLWYQFYTNAYNCYFKIYKISGGNDTLLYTANGNQTFHNTWLNISVDVYGQDPFKIVLEADFNLSIFSGIRAILIDDTSIAYRPCQGQIIYTTCLDIEEPIKIQCETQLLVGDISISLEPDNLISQQNTCTEKSTKSRLNTFCSNFNKSDQCEFRVLDFINGYEDCYVTNKYITVTYQCRDTPTTSMESSTASYVSVPLQITSGTPFVESTTQASITAAIVSVLVVVIVAALVFIKVVIHRRRKIAKNSNFSENRQKHSKTDSINASANKTGMTDINMPVIYDNINDKKTINREAHKEEGNYESLSTSSKSVEHMYASAEQESTEPDLSQYQSITNPPESDIHTYDSTDLNSSQYQSLTIQTESDIHTYASTTSTQ
ncbi:unnamed protein product [Mytilus edulis]|uniref:MAM domain-containing protein n=1 Tax=Mytilus edulis TaxID=6550 RepID=A0A8S3Q5X9_MYTED|nr:unnamed protein product [Mytilus edulis]